MRRSDLHLPPPAALSLPAGLVEERARASIRTVLSDLAACAGFRAALFLIVRPDACIAAVEHVGTDLEPEDLERMVAPADEWLRRSTHDRPWAGWHHVPGTPDRPLVGWRPALERVDGDEAWDPDDTLSYPIHHEGAVVAAIQLDAPIYGRVPSGDRRALLGRLGRMAAHSLLTILEREREAERARQAEASRAITASAAEVHSPCDILSAAAHELRTAYGADTIWAVWFAPELEGEAPASPVFAALRDLVLADRLRIVAGWRRGLPHAEAWAAPGWLLVPVGAGPQCYGVLLISRTRSRARWSHTELGGLRQVGRDMGHAVATLLSRSRERERSEELQTTLEHRARLAAAVSHDLSSPLSAIRNYLALLGRADLDATSRQRMLDGLLSGIEQLLAAAESLGALHGAAPEPERSEVDLVGLLHELEPLHASQAIAGGVDLELHTPPGPVAVLASRADLSRVVLNLTDNALKYTPHGGWVQVSLRTEPGTAVLRWVDTGIGIGAADQAHVFEEAYRVDSPQVRERPGTGLGLAIVDHLVARLGGSVHLASELGAGTTVEVRLPLA